MSDGMSVSSPAPEANLPKGIPSDVGMSVRQEANLPEGIPTDVSMSVRQKAMTTLLQDADGRPDHEINAVLGADVKVLSHDQDTFLRDQTRRHHDSVYEIAEVTQPEVTELEVTQLPEENYHEVEARESCERVDKFTAIVSGQKTVHDAIMMCVWEGEKEIERGQKYQRGSLRPGSAAGSAAEALRAGPREINALIVAEKFQENQARDERFYDGRKEVQRREVQTHAEKKMSNEEAESRHALRTEELLWDQNEKIYVNQQKRGDCQRMRQEIQRDEDRRWKIMQAKFYPMQKKHHATRPNSSPSKKTKASSGVNTEDEAEEEHPIYTHMCASHAKYNGTLANFSQFVADNERRTDKDWMKIYGTTKKGRLTELGDKRAKAAKGRDAVKRAVKTALSVHNIRESGESVADAEVPVIDDTITLEPERIEIESPKSMAFDEIRRKRCKELKQDVERAGRAKAVRDLAKQQAAQERSKLVVAQKIAAAGSNNQAWESKNSEATARRQQGAEFNGDAIFKKHEDHAIAHFELKQQQQETLEDRMAGIALLQQSVLHSAQHLTQTNEQIRRIKIEEKSSVASDSNKQKLAGLAYRNDPLKHAKELEAVLQRRQGFVEEFRQQASSEIDCKLVRSTSALKRVKKAATPSEALENRRPQSCTAASRRPQPSELSLPYDMVPPSGLFALSTRDIPDSPSSGAIRERSATDFAAEMLERATPKAMQPLRRTSLTLTPGTAAFRAAGQGIEPPSPASAGQTPSLLAEADPIGFLRHRFETAESLGQALTPSAHPRHLAEPSQEPLPEASGRRHPRACRSNLLRSSSMTEQANLKSPTAHQRRPSHQSATSDKTGDGDDHLSEDSGGEEEHFLQELEERSAKWLKEARRKVYTA